jgi:hypothetical protein
MSHTAAIRFTFRAPDVPSTFVLCADGPAVPTLHQVDTAGRVVADFDPTALVPLGRRAFVSASDLVRSAIDDSNRSAATAPEGRWPLPVLLAGTRFIAAALASTDLELAR